MGKPIRSTLYNKRDIINGFKDILSQGKQVTKMIKASWMCLFLALEVVSFFTFSRLTNIPYIFFLLFQETTQITTYRQQQIESLLRNGKIKEISVQFSFYQHL